MKRSPDRSYRIPLGALVLAGCASTPETPSSLTQARESFQVARNNPHVPRFAAAELNQAGQALDRVEQLWTAAAMLGSSITKLTWPSSRRVSQPRRPPREQRARRSSRRISSARVSSRNRAQRRRGPSSRMQKRLRGARSSTVRRLSVQAETARKQALHEKQRADGRCARKLFEESARAEALQAQGQAGDPSLETQLEDMKAEQTSRGWVLTFGSGCPCSMSGKHCAEGRGPSQPGAHRDVPAGAS
jgi:hypothetical protein